MKAARRAGPSVHGVLLWALSTNAAGGHEGEIPISEWDAETVAVLIGCDGDGAEVSGADQAQRAFDELVRSGFMVLDGENIMLPAWSKWRPESSSADRVRAWRERQAAQKQDETLRNVTSVSVTQEERRGEESRREEKRETTRARTRGVAMDQVQDHPLTDATRTDLDADSKRLASHTATDADTIERAREKHAPLFRRLRLAVQPSDRIRNDLVWNQMLPSATRSFAEAESCCASPAEFAAALTWAMQDAGDEKFPGWRRVLSTPSKVAEKFADGAVLEQYRASGEVAKRERETGHSRRSAGPEPPDYAAITREREAYEKRVREEFEASERAAGRPPARQPQRRGGDPTPLGAVLKEVLR